jgi:putative solute:sodium symporter small subunit
MWDLIEIKDESPSNDWREMILLMAEDTSGNESLSLQMTAEEFETRVKQLRRSLLFLWASLTFCVAFFAHDLNFEVFERPFGFWMAAQGSVLGFLAITWTYALLVNRWEKLTYPEIDD